MAVRFYEDPSQYVDDATTTAARITRIKEVITALETAALKSAGTANLENYSFNDGQAQISAKYNSPTAIAKAIETYEMILSRLQQKVMGRTTILRDLNSGLV